MIKDERLFLEEWVVVDFLKKIGDLSKKSKYIELLIALTLNKFCERQFGGKCWIGLEIQERYKGEIPSKGTATFEQLSEIITKKVEEGTPIDVTIGKMPGPEDYVSRGMNFQIKRFGKNKYKQDTQSLIDFLNVDCKEYAKTRTNLIVVVESPEEIDLQLLQKSLQSDGYPFEKIILIGVSENKYVNYYGIWPESGMSRFNLEKLDFDY